jgi:sugar/nucleoside kinase (ribokinase family)
MIICIGSINVDFIFATGRWPGEHEKYHAENYVCANGGAAANTARELSRLGRKVRIVGGIGNDDLGHIALKGLIAAGVQIDIVDRTGGGDAFDAGFLDAWLSQSALNTCLEQGLRSAAIILGQPG